MLEPIAEIVNLAQWEWFRLRRRVGFLILAILLLLIPVAVLAGVVFQNLKELVPGLEVAYFEPVAGALSAVTPVLAVILAALVFAVDLQGGNCRTLAARGAARMNILAAKALTAALVLLAYHLIAYMLAGLPALVFAPHFEGWDTGATNTATAFLNSLLYLSLGIVLSHWWQSTALTVGVGIALIAIEAIAYPIAGLVGETLGWPLSDITAWTIRGVAQGLQGDSEVIARAWYIPIVAGYAAVLLALALTLFQKFDLRPGGE